RRRRERAIARAAGQRRTRPAGRAAGLAARRRPGSDPPARAAGRRQPRRGGGRPGGDRRRRPDGAGGGDHPDHRQRAAADRPGPRGAGGGRAQRRAPDGLRHRPQRRAAAGRRAAVRRRARGRPAVDLGPGRALPGRVRGGHGGRAAAGRQPRLPGGRSGAGGAAGPRPRRAAAARLPAGARGRCRRACAGAGRHRSEGAGAMSRSRNGWVLPVSLLVALLLGLVPLPEFLQPLRPYWLALVLAYWLLEAPDRVGLGAAFVVGVLADLAFGSLLGEQALRLVVLAFILERFRARLRFFPLSQQALAIGVLLFNDRVVGAVLHLLVGLPQLPWLYWAAPVLGMLLWAPLHFVLDALRLRRPARP